MSAIIIAIIVAIAIVVATIVATLSAADSKQKSRFDKLVEMYRHASAYRPPTVAVDIAFDISHELYGLQRQSSMKKGIMSEFIRETCTREQIDALKWALAGCTCCTRHKLPSSSGKTFNASVLQCICWCRHMRRMCERA